VRDRFSTGIMWPAPRPDATQVLVCFGYCGGGTVPFRLWHTVLSETVDLALVCYPGRERRIAEPPAHTFDELVQDALASVYPLAHRPYVLFGHSMGAWVAFEVAVHLERSAAPPPQALIVSASTAPSLAEREQARPPRADTDDEELLDWMRRAGQLPELILAEPDLRQFAVDLFRADKLASESYRFRPGSTVRAPMQVLRGVDDDEIDADDAAWSALAAGPCRIDRLPGGHFYTHEVWAALPRHMRAVDTGPARRFGGP
jgi:surfactin synthase thioesterase subunit